jgi:hypothetical protein
MAAVGGVGAAVGVPGTASAPVPALPKLFADLDRALRQALYEKANDLCAASTLPPHRQTDRERERETWKHGRVYTH